MKTIFVSGTWGYGRREETDWWEPGSAFLAEAATNGVDLADPVDPFIWDTNLDGVWGGNAVWEAAGHHLVDYARARELPVVDVVTHSHGAQVAAYATEYGLFINRLITVAAPIRPEIQRAWAAARLAGRIDRWTHIYGGGRDWWQLFGELAQGQIRPVVRRQFP